MHINPYIAGNPIDEAEAFFGRDDVLRDVTAVLRNRNQNAIVLYGQRRIGKTSILLQLEKRLAADGQYTPVYFDLMDKAGKPLVEVLRELAQRINLSLNQPPPDFALFDVEGAYFRDTFLPQAAQLAASGGLVLLFDEFDVLDGPDSSQSAGQTFFPYLRAWMNRAAGAQFVFVIGRRPEDLSIHTMPTFKGVSASQVALLDRRDTEAIIRQSEEEGSLHWTDEAVTAVWEWTQGHPYFTQLLCEAVWNEAYRDEPEDPPTARLEMVEAAVKPVLNSGANAFVWLWDGLPPAERYVMAVLAGADKDAITQDELIDILNQSGVRLALGQLVVAPETLEKWGTLRQVNDGYQFAVPILRHWIQINRKLSLVKEELNRIEPEADKLFKAAQVFYDKGNLDVALQTVNFTLEINPRHNDARILLGQINLDQGQLPEAVKILEEVYDDGKYSSGRHLLITTLLRLAETQRVENDQLATYERVLMIVPEHRVAKARRQAILDARRKRELAKKQADAAKLAAQEDWAGVIGVYEALLQEFPEEADWQAELSKAQNQLRWQRQYNEALGALKTGDHVKAQQLLAAIIAETTNYKDTARYFLQAVTKLDMVELIQHIKVLQADATAAQEQVRAHAAETQERQGQIAALQTDLDAHMAALEEQKQQLAHLQAQNAQQETHLNAAQRQWNLAMGGSLFVVMLAVASMLFMVQQRTNQQEIAFATTLTALAPTSEFNSGQESTTLISPSPTETIPVLSETTSTPFFVGIGGTTVYTLDVRVKPLGLLVTTVVPSQAVYGLQQTTNKRWIEVELSDNTVGWILNDDRVNWNTSTDMLPTTAPTTTPTPLPSQVRGIGKFADCYSAPTKDAEAVRNILGREVTAIFRDSSGDWFYIEIPQNNSCWGYREDIKWENENDLNYLQFYPAP